MRPPMPAEIRPAHRQGRGVQPRRAARHGTAGPGVWAQARRVPAEGAGVSVDRARTALQQTAEERP